MKDNIFLYKFPYFYYKIHVFNIKKLLLFDELILNEL